MFWKHFRKIYEKFNEKFYENFKKIWNFENSINPEKLLIILGKFKQILKINIFETEDF